jgi:hypothetical protein
VDAFEQVVAELFWAQGYWVRTSVKVNLTKEEKAEADRPTMPRPEIDVVAYHGGRNHMLALECKSYLDSRGVTFREVCGEVGTTTYKLFRRESLRTVVLRRLAEQSIAQGLCRPGVTVQLGMIAGKVASTDEPKLRVLFDRQGWFFEGPAWLKEQIKQLSGGSYENQVAAVVSKLLLRR